MYIRDKSQTADYERLSFCAVLRSLDFIWKATKRFYTRKEHNFNYFKNTTFDNTENVSKFKQLSRWWFNLVRKRTKKVYTPERAAIRGKLMLNSVWNLLHLNTQGNVSESWEEFEFKGEIELMKESWGHETLHRSTHGLLTHFLFLSSFTEITSLRARNWLISGFSTSRNWHLELCLDHSGHSWNIFWEDYLFRIVVEDVFR